MESQNTRAAIGFTLIALAATSGCSSLRIEHTKTSSIRKVAVVGFSLEQTMPLTGEGVAKSIFLPADDTSGFGNPAPFASVSPQAEQVYEKLREQLEKTNGWRVSSIKELRNHPAYQELVRASERGFQPRPQLSKKGNQLFRPDGIAEHYWVSRLSETEKSDLARKLGVDGIVAAHTDVALQNAGVISIGVAGDLRSQASTRLGLYIATDGSAIWEDFDAKGEPTDETVEHTLGFANTEKVHLHAKLAAEKSYRKLLARFQENK
jgi:hypothetical protein